jgi:16S rRNA (cytosine967-C5)-methyltransferase
LIALRLGAFQLLHLDRIPARAAIDESVELAKQAGHRFASGMVNAVLRKLAKAAPAAGSQLEEENLALKGHDFSCATNSATSARALAPEGSFSVEMDAHPTWMVERWISFYGLDSAHTICIHGQSQPVLTLRLTDSTVEAELHAAGIALEPGELLATSRTVISGDVSATDAYREGRVRLQDEGSQLVNWLAVATRIPTKK